ncbi:MAG: 30S ribosomal protein S18 [Candidatus Obscuribacterales bacterium]|jgi:small subunit ribosomal protein S18|nr:30S ribosomal protein S18 [Candidatus Obscuribacterales bacterium]
MARRSDPYGDPRRKKVDPIAANKIEFVDYKDVNLLRKFLSDTGKILPARITGCSRMNQRMIAAAIKRSRAIGLLPFTVA